jgi:peptidoglycan pentaglycine glycine transferase (the first glycine)
MSARVWTDPAPQVWDSFVADHPQAHILQTSSWGELKAAFGWKAQRLALLEGARRSEDAVADDLCSAARETESAQGDRWAAGAQILYRRLPGGLGRLAYVPRGPLVDWEDPDALTPLLDALRAAARARGAAVLTLEPDLSDEPRHQERLAAHGFVPSPLGSVQPRRTVIVDLAGDEETILAAMKSKTRYNVRLAARKGVRVREGTSADLATFHRLTAATAARDRFGVHAPLYYRRAFELFVPRGWARLLMAEVGAEAVAALMVFALGSRAWYFYGASGDAHREKMPNHLLQWEAMRWARSLGCVAYDLWGVPDEDEERLEAEFGHRRDGLWGVYRFKRGFGGRLVRTVGAWDLPLRPLSYRLYTLAARLLRGSLS